MAKPYKHIGYVTYNAHPAAPLVIGDFEVMKDWKGNPDGNDVGEIELQSGTVVGLDLELTAPEVFSTPHDEVILLAQPGLHHSLIKSASLDELVPALDAPLIEVHRKWRVEVPSGAIVFAIAYNATPEAGADTSGLDVLCFHAGLPRLPNAPPTAPIYFKNPPDGRGLAIVPVTPGMYEISLGDTLAPFMKCIVRPRTAATRASKPTSKATPATRAATKTRTTKIAATKAKTTQTRATAASATSTRTRVTKATETPTPRQSSVAPPTVRLELRSASSSKFWEAHVRGSKLHVRYGRIGATGTVQVKRFKSAAAASVARDKLVRQKRKKGYSRAGPGR